MDLPCGKLHTTLNLSVDVSLSPTSPRWVVSFVWCGGVGHQGSGVLVGKKRPSTAMNARMGINMGDQMNTNRSMSFLVSLFLENVAMCAGPIRWVYRILRSMELL